MDLQYPLDEANEINGLAEIIEECAASKLSRDQLIDWFESHKTWIED